MDNLNNIPNVGNWGDAASKLNDNFNKIKQSLTTVENTSKNNKGYFTSLSALNTAFPSPKDGQTAYVYDEASSTQYYIYNAVNGAWVATSIEAPSIEVDLNDYTKTGGSTKTTKEVEDDLVQLAGDVKALDSEVVKYISREITPTLYQGGIAIGDSQETDSIYLVRTDFIESKGIKKATCITGLESRIFLFDKNKSYKGESKVVPYAQIHEHIDVEGYFKIVIKKTTSLPITPEEVGIEIEIYDELPYVTINDLYLKDYKFEFGAVDGGTGVLLSRNDRIRTVPVYFETKDKIGQLLTFPYTPSIGVSPIQAFAYMDGIPVKNISTLASYTFSDGNLRFIYDGTFNNIRFSLAKPDGSTLFTKEELSSFRVPNINSVPLYKGELNLLNADIQHILAYNIDKVFNANVTYPTQVINTSTIVDDIYALYDSLVSNHTSYVAKQNLGLDSSGIYPINKYTFKPVDLYTQDFTKKRLKIIIVSGTHAEPLGIWSTFHLMENICNNWEDDALLEFLRFNVEFIVIPILNPWGNTTNNRKNYNSVDLNRNFSEGWTLIGDVSSYDYSGPSPLSEKEAQYADNVFSQNRDAVAIIDFHNFFGTSDTGYFVWTVAGNELTFRIADAHGYRMLSKWAKEYGYITADTKICQSSGNAGGQIAFQGNKYGIPISCTYENCYRMWLDPSGSEYDSTVMTISYEAFTNFILQIISNS